MQFRIAVLASASVAFGVSALPAPMASLVHVTHVHKLGLINL